MRDFGKACFESYRNIIISLLMKIIPAINEADFSKVKEKLLKAAGFSDWAQIDIADGKFTPHKIWNNPDGLKKSQVPSPKFQVNIELHLMVENPQDAIDGWLKTGAKRIIVHFEAIKNSAAGNPDNDESDIINFILAKCETAGAELGLAINPDTPAEELLPYLDKIKFIQILAVNPGLAGQGFQKSVLDKIKFLKELDGEYINIIVEVDGGINLETAKLCKQAGADILASASYIWNSENQKAAFEELSAV